jgi:hypothetical protein
MYLDQLVICRELGMPPEYTAQVHRLVGFSSPDQCYYASNASKGTKYEHCASSDINCNALKMDGSLARGLTADQIVGVLIKALKNECDSTDD